LIDLGFWIATLRFSFCRQALHFTCQTTRRRKAERIRRYRAVRLRNSAQFGPRGCAKCSDLRSHPAHRACRPDWHAVC
jgi:hypothetical protein